MTTSTTTTLATRITSDMVPKMSTAELRLAIKQLAGAETNTRNTTAMRKRVLALLAQASTPAPTSHASAPAAAPRAEAAAERPVRKPKAAANAPTAAVAKRIGETIKAKAAAEAIEAPKAEAKTPEKFQHDHRVLAIYKVGDRIEKRDRNGKLVASVEVVKDGFSWHGKTYESLSPIAGEVSGTEQSGLVYFGVIPYNDRGRKGKTTADLAPAFKRAAELVNAAEGPGALILPTGLESLETMDDHAQAREYLRIIREAQARIREDLAALAIAQNLLEVRHGRVLLKGEVA